MGHLPQINSRGGGLVPAGKPADAPNFERYDEKFDPAIGNGALEIWIPVRE
jgi:hypothetical protein